MPVRNLRTILRLRARYCPEAIRSGHIGCSHTTARHVLRDALNCIPGGGVATLRHELNELENAISLLDHRRYDAETRHAQAIDAGTPAQTAAARRAIDGLVSEHRAYVARALVLRDAVLALVDAALVSRMNMATAILSFYSYPGIVNLPCRRGRHLGDARRSKVRAMRIWMTLGRRSSPEDSRVSPTRGGCANPPRGSPPSPSRSILPERKGMKPAGPSSTRAMTRAYIHPRRRSRGWRRWLFQIQFVFDARRASSGSCRRAAIHK